ncbi:MAG: AEC family transporter [Myxococcaceae bacterium]|nr:AEC family transporter [Myxococcaceae bacterium]
MLGLLLGCFALGALARRVSSIPRETPKVLNAWVLNVSLPALVLKAVHAVPLEPRFLLGAAVLWALFGVAALAAVFAVRRGWATREVAGALALSVGLGNTAFVGVPLVEMLGGAAAVGPAVMFDQLGSFLVFAAGALPFAMLFGGERARASVVVKRVVTFPPFLALTLALLLRPVAFPAGVDVLLARFADMLTPLALVSVGWQLELAGLAGNRGKLLAALCWKLGVAPAAMLGVLLATGGGALTLNDRVAVAQAAMAPMVTAAVLAAEYRLAAPLSAALAAVGALASFATVPAWWALTGRFLAP